MTGSIALVSSAANSNLTIAVTGAGVSPGSLTASPASSLRERASGEQPEPVGYAHELWRDQFDRIPSDHDRDRIHPDVP